MVTELGDKLNPVRTDRKYTLRSMRSSYITNQIEEGKDVYLVKQLTGHSLEILNRHYDRSQIKSRRAEATRRQYGKKEEDLTRIDLENLDAVKSKQSKTKAIEAVTDEDMLNQYGADYTPLKELHTSESPLDAAITVKKMVDDGLLPQDTLRQLQALMKEKLKEIEGG